jgi:5-methylcytosine-specific restriction endonuclease McrA
MLSRMLTLDGLRTLVLDAAFRPLRSIGWQRALVWSMDERVEVLEVYDRVAHSAHRTYVLPAVLRLPGYRGRYPTNVAMSRRNVLARDGFRCQYCGRLPPNSELTVDHVMPRSRGGATSWENLVAACEACNHRKGDRTPQEAKMPLRTTPTRPLLAPMARRGIGVEVPPQWITWLPEDWAKKLA